MSSTEDHGGESQVYELSYLLLPSLPAENLPQVVSKIQSAVEKGGGKVFDSEEPFLKTLAYNMSKTIGASHYVVNNAYIGWLKFDVLPEQVEAIKSTVEKMEEILRFLLVKAERETRFTFASVMAEEEAEVSPEEKVSETEESTEEGDKDSTDEEESTDDSEAVVESE